MLKKINYLIIIFLLILDMFFILNSFVTNDFKRIIAYLCLPLVIFIPFVLKKLNVYKMSEDETFLYLIFIIISDFLGCVINLYNYVSWFDKFSHFYFGLYSFFLGIKILKSLNIYNKKKCYLTIFIVIIISIAFAGMWEMFEYTCDKLFNMNLQQEKTTGVNDTMQDMLVSTLGCLICCFIYVKNCRKYKKIEI